MHGWTLLLILAMGVTAYLYFSGFFRTLRLYRGVRVITCPENLQPAAVNVNAFRAAKWLALSGESEVRLRDCSRWPEKAGCAEGCLSQIQDSPEGCLVQSIVTNWYAGKHCHFCGREIEEIAWHERPPAVLQPDGTTHEWKELKPEELPAVFATALPACWPCHLVETFRREHPDKVVVASTSPAGSPHAMPPSSSVY